MQLGFYVKEFFDSLVFMGKGMLGIFVVILVIFGCIALLNKLFSPKKEEE